MTHPESTIKPGPEALKALSHPDRLRILGLLRIEGPQTATLLAARLGLNSGATSYHLRQLARHGFLDEAMDLGTGRERWWRAAQHLTHAEDDQPPGSEEAETVGAYLAAVVTRQVSQILHASAQHASLPAEWRRASTASDATAWLTAEQARAVSDRLEQELRAVTQTTPPIDGPGPEGARRFTVQIHTFPYPGFGKEE